MANYKTKKKKKSKFVQILPYIAIVLVAAALIFAVVYMTNKKPKSNEKGTAAELSSIETNTNGQLVKNGNPAITELMNQYFTALSEADVNTLEQIVDSEQSFSKDALEKESKYVDAYDNIICYTVDGILKDSYIVYVYYELKFTGIETAAPSLERFYVCENSDGTMYINDRTWDGEVSSYMEEVASWADVRSLVTAVQTNEAEAREKDESLDSFIKILEGESTADSGKTDTKESESANEMETTTK